MKYWFYILLCIGLVSCLEKDPLINPPGATEVFFELDPKSTNKVFLSVENKEVVKQCSVDSIWHLKFQNGEGNWAIFLNPSLDISLYNTEITNYSEIDYTYVLEDLEWVRDFPLSSTVLPSFGTWGDYSFNNPKSFKNVYLLRAKIGLNLSYYKIQILDAVGGNYRIRFGKLDGSVDNTYLVEKNSNYTHSYIYLGSKPRKVSIEPPLDQWEFALGYGLDSINNNHNRIPTKYINDFIGVYQLIVTNKAKVKLSIVDDISFEEIDYFYAKNLDFMGYDQIPNVLAEYNFDRNIYEASENVSLVIKKDNLYYKVKASNVSSISPFAVSMLLSIESL
ncbi:hypothetical protein GYB22_05805 [bacterium]|nr:hypothetical protein [bacterium]